jgi:hypothetical protein
MTNKKLNDSLDKVSEFSYHLGMKIRNFTQSKLGTIFYILFLILFGIVTFIKFLLFGIFKHEID